MRFLFYPCIDAIVAGLLLAPFFGIMNRHWLHSSRRTILYFLFSLYLAGVYSVVGLPNISYIRFEPDINIIPFRDMISGLSAALLNVILFLPFGFFLTILWGTCRSRKQILIWGFSLSLCIELLQIFTFRVTDVNDLITNTLGTLLGWMLGCRVVRFVPSLSQDAAKQDLPVILAATFFVMFFLHPFLSSLVWTCFL